MKNRFVTFFLLLMVLFSVATLITGCEKVNRKKKSSSQIGKYNDKDEEKEDNKEHGEENDAEGDNNDAYESIPPIDSSQYDSVLAVGDGYYLVSLFSETYASASTAYGVVNESGEWVCSLSSSNGFATAVAELMSDGYNQAFSTPQYAYLGNGIFVVKVRCVIVGKEYVPSGYWNDWGFHGGCYLVDYSGQIRNSGGFMITEIYDGYAFTMQTNGRVDRLDLNGNSVEIGWRTSGKAEYIGIPSCGLVCCGNVFYDVKTGDAVIDLTEYDLVENDCRYFEDDGTYTFEFYNPARSRYRATIDVTGKFVSEPIKIP